MILTVTLNPAVDKTYTTGELMPGHVNRVESMENIPGGKGINVSKILRQYARTVTATGFLGGYTGKWIEERVREMGVECAFAKTQGDTRCSMNVIAGNGFVTEILEPGPWISAEERLVFFGKYRELVKNCELAVLSGSAARGLPQDIYADLIKIARTCGKRVILDTSQELLSKGVDAGPYLVKPNRRELEFLAGHKCSCHEEVLNAAQKLLEKDIAYVAVSVGERGMYLISRERRLFARAPRVKALNTVGSGDCACASFAMSILDGEDMERMLCRAVAVSAANVATMESGSIPEGLAEEFVETVKAEEL